MHPGAVHNITAWSEGKILTLVLLNPDIPCLCKHVDLDHLASEEANWSGSALFVIKYVYLYQTLGSSTGNLIGWKLDVCQQSFSVAIYQHFLV